MGGIVGLMFREFAVTVAVSILVSVAVSLTLTPMMCARLLPGHEGKPPGRISGWLESVFTWLNDRYDDGLKVALRHRFLTLLTFFGTIALTGYLFWTIPKGFFHSRTRA